MKYREHTTNEVTAGQLAEATAITVHKRFKGYVEREDLEQECWVWYLAHKEQADAWLTAGTPGKVRGRMFRAAQKAARRMKAGSSYQPEDEAFYSTRAILSLLPEALDPQSTPGQGASDTGRVSGASKDGYDDWQVTMADIRSAFAKLPPLDQEVLILHCRDGYSPDELGMAYKLDTETVYKRIGRALRRMRGHLGGVNPWT